MLRILDYAISVLMGAGTLLIVTLVVGREWNMLLAMIAGMGLGVLVLMVSLPVFLLVSSPFELVPSGMVITMLTGMFSAMAVTMTDIDISLMLPAVTVFSLLVQIWIDSYNRELKGEVRIENGK